MVLKPSTGRQQIDFTPNWKPLEEKLGARCQEFMFMGRVGSVNLYKHIFTRRYLNLDDSGKCYVYRERRYELAEFDAQIAYIDPEKH
jgi:hypothetical protein